MSNPKATPRRRAPNNLQTAWNAKGYRFIEKDPDIAEIATIIELSGMEIRDIAYQSGVSPSTIKNWLYGDTRKPQNITLRAVARACGWDRKWGRL